LSSSPPRAWRGEVWLVGLDPTIGHEQKKTRPAVVVSANTLNGSAAEMVVVVPLTKTPRSGIPLNIEVRPPEGGLQATSYAMPEQIRSVSTLRLLKRLGRISSAKKLAEIDDAIRITLSLP
jgi:mRNA interferase MazF